MDELSHPSITLLYRQLQQIIEELEKPPLQAALTKRITLFTKNFLAFAQHHPDPLFAQPQLYKTQFPHAINLTFNTLVYICLIASRNKLDDSVHLQLLCASICLSTNKEPEPVSSVNNQQTSTTEPFHELLSLLKSSRWQICRHILTVNEYLRRYIHKSSDKLAQLDPLQSIVFIATKLAKLTTGTVKHPPISFALSLKKVSIDAPQNWYHTLRPLIVYPSLIPPGSCIKDKHELLHISLAVQGNTHLLFPLTTKKLTPTESVIEIVNASHIKQIFAAQKLTNINKVDEYWGLKYQHAISSKLIKNQAWHNKISLSAPSPNLSAIQNELNAPQPNVNKVVEILEQETTLSTQLQNIASSSNRLTLAISSSRHGLLMNGFERSYQALLQYSLLARLTQESFPLKNKLVNFTQLLCFTADELAKISGSKSSDLASTVCLFALSYYFVSPMIRTRLQWQTNPEQRYHFNRLFKLEHAEHTNQFPLKMAMAWQQPSAIINALKHLLLQDNSHSSIATSNKDISQIIGLAIIASRQIYFCENNTCKQTALFQQNALSHLKLSTHQLSDLLEKVACKKQIYCSLNT